MISSSASGGGPGKSQSVGSEVHRRLFLVPLLIGVAAVVLLGIVIALVIWRFKLVRRARRLAGTVSADEQTSTMSDNNSEHVYCIFLTCAQSQLSRR